MQLNEQKFDKEPETNNENINSLEEIKPSRKGVSFKTKMRLKELFELYEEEEK
ncbi:MAG: hypothetical protein WC872_00680 [Candidatus Absconditabacterales bacterium]